MSEYGMIHDKPFDLDADLVIDEVLACEDGAAHASTLLPLTMITDTYVPQWRQAWPSWTLMLTPQLPMAFSSTQLASYQ
jgi:hypothetical protein